MFTFDFEYKCPEGNSVIVEVDYFYEEPNPLSRESDWDFYGGLFIDAVRVYSGGEEVDDIYISGEEIQYQFKKYARDMEESYVMESNQYF